MPPSVPDTRAPGARHDCTLPQWAVDKMIRRRGGRTHAFEDLDPRRTALVAVDLLASFVDGTPCGASTVAPVNRLAAALRDAGGTVAWVTPAPLPERSPSLIALWGEDWYREAARGADAPLADGLDVADGDLHVEKRAYSAFFPGRCDLPDILRARGVDTVLIAGMLTNICCESSARDAATLGFRVVMVSDANAARSDEEHRAALYNVMRNFGDVRTSGDLVAAFAG